MSGPVTRSVRASAVIGLDAAEAFRRFTEEMHLWYRVSDVTVSDPSKTVSLRIEPGLGGRLVEVHDAASGEGADLGTIRAWSPGERLVFEDVRGSEIEVRFASQPEGTLVSIEHHGIDQLPEEAAARVRRFGWHTVLDWFEAHARPEGPPTFSGVVPYLFYEDAAAMLDWYRRVFGFVEKARWTGVDGRVHNAEMSVGSTEVWLDGGGPRRFDADGKRAAEWIGVWVDDVDAMLARVEACGVDVKPPVETEYGVRMLMVEDPEGYSWGFMQRVVVGRIA